MPAARSLAPSPPPPAEGRRQRGRHERVHLVRLLVGAHRRLEVLLLELELLRLLHVLLLHLLRRVGRRRLHRHARRGRGQSRRRRRRRARRRAPGAAGQAARRGPAQDSPGGAARPGGGRTKAARGAPPGEGLQAWPGVALPDRYRGEDGGQFESAQAASRVLLVVGGLVILVVFAILVVFTRIFALPVCLH